MQSTTPQELCKLQLPSGPTVGLYRDGDRYYTQSELPGGETLTVEITNLSTAYEWYLLAADEGDCLSAFPEPVPELPAPALKPRARRGYSSPGTARVSRTLREAGVARRQVAAKIGVHLSTLYDWDKRGDAAFANAKFQRYVDVLEALERGEPFTPSPAPAPDGKRRCAHPGCDAILSRWNDGDECACHAQH